jgi:hypothetical protein
MTHPYRGLSDEHFWSRSVATPGAHEIDPVVTTSFTIGPNDRVATMGSCFAQHLSRFIQRSGLNYFVPEGGQIVDGVDPVVRNFGVFSARYGNVYTVRQALQLLKRAYGEWEPAEAPWRLGDRWVDPFRPQVEPGGWTSLTGMEADRVEHLAAVRRLFDQTDVLVFTLGLTETWRSREDGAVFPVVPGASGGKFDPADYEFVNFNAAEVSADLLEFADILNAVNPTAKLLLTVSPVPLIATYSEQHVLAATAYSKSVLRVAAAEAEQQHEFVSYFPSYEVITSPAAGGRYFEPDLRSVTDDGVAHVMRVFAKHYFADTPAAVAGGDERILLEFERTSSVVCDEEVLDRR